MALDKAAGKRLRDYMEPRIGAVQPWCERAGVGRDTVYALWRGREPRPATMRKIADGLGLSYSALTAIRDGVPEALQATETPADLAGAIYAQSRAIEGLTAEIRVAALAVLGSQEGTAGLLADLVRLAGEGRLDELAPLLRPRTWMSAWSRSTWRSPNPSRRSFPPPGACGDLYGSPMTRPPMVARAPDRLPVREVYSSVV